MTLPANPEWQTRYRWAASLVAEARVLDAGCGIGLGTAVLAEEGAKAVGVDLSPAAIIEAHRDRAGEATSFREGDVRKLPFGEGEFDHVICFETLAHVANPERVVDELRRVLRPGGLLFVSSPNRDVYPPGNPLHLSELNSEELERLLSERFANVAIYRQQSYHASLLGPPELLAHDTPDVAIAATVTKVVTTARGGELHAVAVASDGKLPKAPAWLSLGDEVDYNEQAEQLREWQERAVRAEATALARARELRELQR